MNNVFSEYELYLKAVIEANRLNKTGVFDALAAAGVTRVTLTFDGASDSGQIEEVTAYAGKLPTELPSTSLTLQIPKIKDDFPTVEATLSDSIETLCYGYLSQYADGWENDDGAYGTFEFDVRKRRIRLDFNERFTGARNSTRDF